MNTGTPVGLYLACVQFVFALGWIIYVIYLPTLAQQAGLPKASVPWLLLMDQLVFAASDLAAGLWADRAARVLGKVGAWVLGTTLVSAALFLALPFIAPQGSPTLFVAVTLLWAATSSALRAPPLTLLGRYVAKPSVPWMASLMLLGTGIATALGPYLGLALRGLDPRTPFVMSALALAALVAGMVLAERTLSRQGATLAKPAAADAATVPHEAARRSIAGFLLATGLAAAAAQLHANIFSAPLYLRHAPASELPLLMQVFWAGFNLALMPASLAVRRWGAVPVMAAGALTAAAASVAAANAGSMPVLLAAQGLAGAAWGTALMSGFAAAVFLGHVGREGFMGGALNAVLAGAAFSRIALVSFVAPAPALLASGWAWLPGLGFALAAALLWVIGSRVGMRGRV